MRSILTVTLVILAGSRVWAISIPSRKASAEASSPAAIAATVAKDMRQSQQQLRALDTGDSTRHLQGRIIRGLDLLIASQNQAPASGKSGAPAPASQPGAARPQARSQPKPRPDNRDAPGTAIPSIATPTTGSARSTPVQSSSANRAADLYQDVWGHLPDDVRKDLDQYAREQFMPKYADLLRQYYLNLATKEHRKRD